MAYNPPVAGAFFPIGNTVVVTADNTAPAAVQVVQNYTTMNSYCQYRIYNSGSGVVFLGYGNTALNANSSSSSFNNNS